MKQTAKVIDFPNARATRRRNLEGSLIEAVVTWMHEAAGDLVDRVDVHTMCLGDYTSVEAAVKKIELYRAGKLGSKPKEIRGLLWTADFLLNTRLRLLSPPVSA